MSTVNTQDISGFYKNPHASHSSSLQAKLMMFPFLYLVSSDQSPLDYDLINHYIQLATETYLTRFKHAP